MVKTFDFREQLAVGEAGEAELDALFGQWYDIASATMAEQLTGVDRWFVRQVASPEGVASERFGVEYKTDSRAAQTGNAFIEMCTVHTDGRQVAGWAYSSMSRWLIYYVPERSIVYVLSFAELRKVLHREWKHEYRSAHVSNLTWDTYGILVPLAEIGRVARKTLTIERQ